MLIAIGILLVLMVLLGAPLFAVIAASVLANFALDGVDLTVVIIEVYRLAEMPVLLAIPLFTFAGYLLAESNAPKRLVRITNVFFGWMPGGLAAVALVICAMFTAFTGASGVTIVALGGMLYPALKQAGYPERYSLGLVTTSGSIGLLFAPSLPLILYGVVAQQLNIGVPVSISDLFLAGILPGLLIVVMLSIYGLFQKRGPQAKHEPFSGREALAAVREAGWELPLPFIVLGGIYSGYFAVSEAAAVTAIYVFIVEVLIHREITWTKLPNIMRESMVLVGAILIVLSMSLASTNYLLDAEIPAKLFDFIRSHVDNAFTFLLLLNIFLLMLGMMLDIFSALVIMVPLILPIAVGYGIHPVHLGIIFLANMEIAYLMPPMGMNLFISMYRFDRPMLEIFRAVLPFVAILLAAVLIITYWPTLSLALIQG
ncbi:MAG: TRAP transporter large permease subunit [Gammaproteobacteria bacterium]|nr:TRAP transporter large permease subunit [Gammaproteobacteria bacterium]MBU1968642.1 TRAP transporter large permease subunit [Gammaproteobacteria bacterium]